MKSVEPLITCQHNYHLYDKHIVFYLIAFQSLPGIINDFLERPCNYRRYINPSKTRLLFQDVHFRCRVYICSFPLDRPCGCS